MKKDVIHIPLEGMTIDAVPSKPVKEEEKKEEERNEDNI